MFRWLRALVVLAVLVLAALDAGAVGVGTLAVREDAMDAARAGRTTYESTRDVIAGHAAAQVAAREADPANSVPAAGFRIANDGAVTATVTRTADTLVLHRIGPLAHWADVGGTSTSRPF